MREQTEELLAAEAAVGAKIRGAYPVIWNGVCKTGPF